MRWTIEGADRQTGNPRSLSVNATTREDAERIASAQGIMVAGVKAAETIEPTAPSASATAVPNYTGLKSISGIFHVLAFLCYLAAALLLISTIIESQNQGRSYGPAPTAVAFQTVTSIAGLAIVGTLYSALGSGCDALRDIARNSWRR